MKKIVLFSCILLIAFSFDGMAKENDPIRLYLVRHAKSSQDDPTLADFDRPLNDRGFSDAPAMGKRLQKMGVSPDILIASPSRRTTQTIQLISREIKFDVDSIHWDSTIYRCRDEDMMTAITSIDHKYKSAMVVGHNPTITNMANFFQTDTVIVEVPTCGVVALQFETTSWSDLRTKKGKLLFFEYPKKAN